MNVLGRLANANCDSTNSVKDSVNSKSLLAKTTLRRGRKFNDIADYEIESELKIRRTMEQLRNDPTLTKKERKKLSNQIAAQKSRWNRR